MKQPITFRLDAELLAEARARAVVENRTLTNYLETVLKQHMADTRVEIERSAGSGHGSGRRVTKRHD
jgi:hypothetical protein